MHLIDFIIRMLLICFSKNITCLYGGPLRICQVFSLSCKTVYRCVMTYCCFMSDVLYTFHHAALVKGTLFVPTSTPRTGTGYIFRTSRSSVSFVHVEATLTLCFFNQNQICSNFHMISLNLLLFFFWSVYHTVLQHSIRHHVI